MRLGFTGTKVGMTSQQRTMLAALIREELPVSDGDRLELHHGDCVGADAQAQAHAIANTLNVRTITHPPAITRHRAFCVADVVLDPAPYRVRDRAIVAACDVLIAAPREAEERLRSGTWATVRDARRLARPVIIIGPDGEVARERC